MPVQEASPKCKRFAAVRGPSFGPRPRPRLASPGSLSSTSTAPHAPKRAPESELHIASRCSGSQHVSEQHRARPHTAASGHQRQHAPLQTARQGADSHEPDQVEKIGDLFDEWQQRKASSMGGSSHRRGRPSSAQSEALSAVLGTEARQCQVCIQRLSSPQKRTEAEAPAAFPAALLANLTYQQKQLLQVVT